MHLLIAPKQCFGLYHKRVSEHAKQLSSDKIKLKCVPGASVIELMDTLSTGQIGSWPEEKNSCIVLSVYIRSWLTHSFHFLIHSYFTALIANADIDFFVPIQQRLMLFPGDGTYLILNFVTALIQHLTGILAWSRTHNKVEWYSAILEKRFLKKPFSDSQLHLESDRFIWFTFFVITPQCC